LTFIAFMERYQFKLSYITKFFINSIFQKVL
jgi:hypothetical protein